MDDSPNTHPDNTGATVPLHDWARYRSGEFATIENMVTAYLGDHAADFDKDGIADAYRAAVNVHLSSTGIRLHGESFYATVPLRADQDDLISDALDAVDLADFLDDHHVGA